LPFAAERKLLKITVILGVVLVILGVAGLAYQGFTVTKEKKVLDLGPLQATAKEKETVPISPVLAWVAVAGGAILVYTGARSRS